MRTRSLVFWLLLVTALGLLGVGGAAAVYSWLWPPAEEAPPGLVVHDTRRDLGEVPLHMYVRLDFPVTNTSDRSLRILGFAGG